MTENTLKNLTSVLTANKSDDLLKSKLVLHQTAKPKRAVRRRRKTTGNATTATVIPTKQIGFGDDGAAELGENVPASIQGKPRPHSEHTNRHANSFQGFSTVPSGAREEQLMTMNDEMKGSDILGSQSFDTGSPKRIGSSASGGGEKEWAGIADKVKQKPTIVSPLPLSTIVETIKVGIGSAAAAAAGSGSNSNRINITGDSDRDILDAHPQQLDQIRLKTPDSRRSEHSSKKLLKSPIVAVAPNTVDKGVDPMPVDNACQTTPRGDFDAFSPITSPLERIIYSTSSAGAGESPKRPSSRRVVNIFEDAVDERGRPPLGVRRSVPSLEMNFKMAKNLGDVLKAALSMKQPDLLKAAEAIFVASLESCEREKGCDNPATLSIVNDLALIMYNQNKLEEASKLHAR
jgi:hypothetical protein